MSVSELTPHLQRRERDLGALGWKNKDISSQDRENGSYTHNINVMGRQMKRSKSDGNKKATGVSQDSGSCSLTFRKEQDELLVSRNGVRLAI